MNEDRIPLIALRDDVALPGENRSIMIGRKSTVEAARSAWEGSRQLAPEFRDFVKSLFCAWLTNCNY
jgi:hypothetical protein